MPEGHTIRRAADRYLAAFGGHHVAVSSPQGRFATEAAVLDGSRLCGAHTHGKHLFLCFDTGTGIRVVHVHFGLFGRLRTHRSEEPPAPQGQIRLRISRPGLTIDLSGPTICALIDEPGMEAVRRRLGPDPLATAGRRTAGVAARERRAAFHARVSRSQRRIAELLMDQRVIAGVGNVYRAETLFLTGTHPHTRGVDLRAADIDALWDTAQQLLARGVRDGRTASVPGSRRGAPRHEQNYVYRRSSCLACAGDVRKELLGGRWCYSCPNCQPLRSPAPPG